MVTPFDDDGALDLPAAVELARWLAEHGSDGLVLSGSTGESSVLTDDEKVDAVAGRGRGGDDPGHGRDGLQRHGALHQDDGPAAADAAWTASSSSRPTTTGPRRPGIFEHFRAVAEAAGDLPVVLYDIPVRSGRRIEHGDHAAPGP